jgi:hypothetical protein
MSILSVITAAENRNSRIVSDNNLPPNVTPPRTTGARALGGFQNVLLEKLKNQRVSCPPIELDEHRLIQQTLDRMANQNISPIELAYIRVDLESLVTTHEQTLAISSSFRQEFAALAEDENRYHQLMQESFGDSYHASIAENIRVQALNNDFSFLPDVQWVNGEVLYGNFGAYESKTETIFLNKDGDFADLSLVYIEEVGHHLDRLMSRVDAAGDEGEIFRLLLTGEGNEGAIQNAKMENDHRVIASDGYLREVEFGAFSKIGDAIRDVGRKIDDAVHDIGSRIDDAVHKAGSSIDDWFHKVGPGIEDAFKKYLAKNGGQVNIGVDTGGNLSNIGASIGNNSINYNFNDSESDIVINWDNINADEPLGAYGVTNSGFATAAYRYLLGRKPNSTDQLAVLSLLESGLSQREVLSNIYQFNEAARLRENNVNTELLYFLTEQAGDDLVNQFTSGTMKVSWDLPILSNSVDDFTYITMLYEKSWGRLPPLMTLIGNQVQLMASGGDRLSLLQKIAASEEAVSMRSAGIDTETLYFLRRQASDELVNQFADDRFSIDLEMMILDRTSSNESYIDAVYRQILGRNADDEGLSYFSEQLGLNKGLTRADVLQAVWSSDEASKLQESNVNTELLYYLTEQATDELVSHFSVDGLGIPTDAIILDKSLSDQDFVNVAFEAIFDREAAPEELDAYSEMLASKVINRPDLLRTLAESDGLPDLGGVNGREAVRWEEYGSSAAVLGFLYDSARDFTSREIESTVEGGGNFWSWYENSESGKSYQEFGRMLSNELVKVLDPNEDTRAYEFIGELTAALVDAYERGELLPRTTLAISAEASGVESAVSDIFHAINFVQQPSSSPEEKAKWGLQEMAIDMMTMKYLGNESFRSHVNAEIATRAEERLGDSGDIGLMFGRTMASTAIGSVVSPIQYLALIGGGTFAVDKAFERGGITGERAIEIYDQASLMSPTEREAFIDEELGHLVNFQDLLEGALFGGNRVE